MCVYTQRPQGQCRHTAAFAVPDPCNPCGATWGGVDGVKENQIPNMSPTKLTTFFFVEHLEPVSKIECFLLIETLPPQWGHQIMVTWFVTKTGKAGIKHEFWGSTLVKRRSPSHMEDPFNWQWVSCLERCAFFSKHALQHVLFLIWVLLKSESMSCVDVWNFATQMIVITTMYYLQKCISSEKQYI